MRRCGPSLACASLLLSVSGAAGARAAPDHYALSLLGYLGYYPSGGQSSQAFAVNDSGQVVGMSSAGTGYHAFLWQDGVGMVDLGALPVAKHSYAYGINNHGQVVGSTHGEVVGSTQEDHRAFLWEAGSGMVDLGHLPGGADRSSASSVNDFGQIVGSSTVRRVEGRGYGHAYLWQSGSGMTDLGVLYASPDNPGDSIASHINDTGQVVGGSFDALGIVQAFLWEAGEGMIGIGGLPGCVGSMAYSINNNGQVVGASYPTSNGEGEHAFLWDRTNGMQDLGAFGGVSGGSNAHDINLNGQVVGISEGRAFVWTTAEGMLDLNDLVVEPTEGWTLTSAMGVNNKGQIVGLATRGPSQEEWQAYLLTPIPEPSTVLAVLCGLGGLVWRRRL